MARYTRYNIYDINFVSNLRQVGGFLRFPPPIKLQGVNFPGFKKLFDKGIRTEYTTVEFPSILIPNYYTLMTGKMFANGTMIGKMLE
jgi:hypothetical protein